MPHLPDPGPNVTRRGQVGDDPAGGHSRELEGHGGGDRLGHAGLPREILVQAVGDVGGEGRRKGGDHRQAGERGHYF